MSIIDRHVAIGAGVGRSATDVQFKLNSLIGEAVKYPFHMIVAYPPAQ